LLLGFSIIYLARPVINGYWGPHLYEYQKSEHNKLIDFGIYGYIRHPIYLGQILMSIATFLLSNSWIIALFPVYIIYTNFKRAEKEEEHLQNLFIDKFDTYKKNVNGWIPKIIRK